jgi:hypothetical protein
MEGWRRRYAGGDHRRYGARGDLLLVPRLVAAGYEVVVVSRGTRRPYRPHSAWRKVRMVEMDRVAAERDGSFGVQIAALVPDVVIDMVCYQPESAAILVEALRDEVQHYLFTGTIWVHGPSVQVPTEETQPRRPFGTYGVGKAATEAYLLDEVRRNGFPATILHPGHIVGPGWVPVNQRATLTRRSFGAWPVAKTCLCPTLGWRRCTMSTRTTSPRRSWARWPTGLLRRRGVPRRVSGGGHPARLCRGGRQLVRPGGSPQILALGGVARAGNGGRCGQDLRPHRPQPKLQHRQSSPPAGYVPRYTSFQAVYEALAWLWIAAWWTRLPALTASPGDARGAPALVGRRGRPGPPGPAPAALPRGAGAQRGGTAGDRCGSKTTMILVRRGACGSADGSRLRGGQKCEISCATAIRIPGATIPTPRDATQGTCAGPGFRAHPERDGRRGNCLSRH